MQNKSKNSKKRCNCPFCRLFLSQLFEIGNSAGSLIGEAVNLFRTFQRLSATKTFATKFSSECEGMFSWATDLVKNIISSFQIQPFKDIELFWLYTVAIPLLILTFIPCLFNGYKQYRYFFFWATFIALGYGISLLKELFVLGIIILGIGVLFLIIFLLLYYFYLKKKWAETDQQTSSVLEAQFTFQVTYAIIAAFFVFSGILIPIIDTRKLLTFILAAFFGAILILSFTFEICDNTRYKEKHDIHFKKIASKIIAFSINCLSLLIIPGTENFADLMKGVYANRWSFIIGYIIITLLLPIITTFLMIKTNYSEVCDRYKQRESGKRNWYCYIELIDIIRQVAYAIVAAFDLPLICLIIEIIWLILIIIFRPYKNVSDYSLALGSSLVMFMPNGGAIYSDYRGKGLFSFKTTVIFVIMACIPAILSMYLFFIFDFDTHAEDNADSKRIGDESLRVVYLISTYVGPFACFVLGINLNTMLEASDNNLI